MDHMTNKKRQFHPKKHLLKIYLSIGIIGICMLAFSAWTPLSVHTGNVESTDTHSQAEHTPGNIQTASPEQTDPIDDSKDSSDNRPDKVPTASSSSPTPTLTPTPTVTPSPTPTSTPTPTPNPLLTDAFDEVNELVATYYSAKLSGEAEDFDSIVSDMSTIDLDYLHIQYGLITDFNNFTCYTKNGIGEIAYVVYVGYDSKIVTIDTPVPALDRLTLVYADDGSGRLLINTASDLSDEVLAYLDELSTHPDVEEMYRHETERFENAIASDPDLCQLYNRLDTEGAD